MTSTTRTEPTAVRQRPSAFRADIEGIRALAVLLVLTYHAGLGPSGGYLGVDIFFVVSGFVITTQILKELERTGRLSLSTFYARRAKRLLPAAGLVLVTTAALTWALAPKTQRGIFGLDIAGSAAYVVNWVLAARSVDYLAEDVEPSPVQHFWSLAVEEQYYLVWPVAIVAIAAIAARGRLPLTRTTLAIGLSVLIVLPTLGWSIYLTSTDPAPAYFVTTTRLWEMGIGAFVALGAARWQRLTGRTGAAIAWAGLAAVLAAAVLYSERTPWPGSAALLPTVGTAAIILGGFSARGTGPARVLGLPALVWIGGLSYSLYLWHWPILRAVTWVVDDVTVLLGVLAVTASVIPAWLSHRFVEDPLRHSAWMSAKASRSLAVGAAISLLCVLIGLAMWRAAGTGQESEATSTGTGWASVTQPPGPQSSEDPPFFTSLTPAPTGATADLPAVYARGCQTPVTEASASPCPDGDPDGEISVAIVGDSKIAQWMSALVEIGDEEGWRMTSYTKSACGFSTRTLVYDNAPYDACREWGSSVMQILQANPPDILITSSLHRRAYDDDGEVTTEAYEESLVDTWSALTARGTQVIALSNTASPPSELLPVYECVANSPEDVSACSWPLVSSEANPLMAAAAERVPGAAFVDMDPWVCPGEVCAGVYRNILTYRQGSHITDTWVKALTEPLHAEISAALERSTTS